MNFLNLSKSQLSRSEMRTVNGGNEDNAGDYDDASGCPGYSDGVYSFNSGNGYSGCACVSEAHAKWGADHNGTSAYLDSRC